MAKKLNEQTVEASQCTLTWRGKDTHLIDMHEL